jgi:hypothetical protein
MRNTAAGFGYTFFNKEVRKFGLPGGLDEFSSRIEDIEHPLLFEPGTKFNYGVSYPLSLFSLRITQNFPDKHRLGRHHR